MRRIATLIATGAVATAAAIGLAASPAGADTGIRIASLHSSTISTTAVSTKAWATSGSSGLAGVTASGRVGWVTKGKTVYLSATVKDTKKDGLSPGLEVKIPGHPVMVVPTGYGKLPAGSVSVREVLGHIKGKTFYITKAAKSYKKII